MEVIVKRCVTFRNRFQFVVEVDYDFAQGHVENHFHAVAGNVFLLDEFAAFPKAKCHNRAYIVGGGDDRGADIRLFDVVNEGGVGQAGRVVHFGHVALFVVDAIAYVGNRRDDVHVKFAVKALLDNLHVEQAEKAAAEAETEGYGAFGLECQRGVVELKFLERGAQILEVFGFDGIDAGKDHGLDLFEAVDSRFAGALHVSDGVAYLDFLARLDA